MAPRVRLRPKAQPIQPAEIVVGRTKDDRPLYIVKSRAKGVFGIEKRYGSSTSLDHAEKLRDKVNAQRDQN